MNGDENAGTKVADFSERVSDLETLAEMAYTIRILACNVEVRLLGHSGPHGESREKDDTESPVSLVHQLRTQSNRLRASLQTISSSLQRIQNELGGVGLDDNKPEESPGERLAPVLVRRS